MFALVPLWGALLSAPPEVPEPIQNVGTAATIRVRDSSTAAIGTGVVIGSRDGEVYVLTAAHVVSPTGKLLAETFTAASRLKPDSFHKGGQLVFRNVEADLAVIRFPAGKRDWTVVRIGSPGREVRVESGWAIGCDDGAPPRITAVTLKGKKLVRRPDGGSAFYWQADGKSVPGRSGGPLFDGSGQLIGICSGTQDGKTYYTHPDEIRVALKAHRLAWVLDGKGGR